MSETKFCKDCKNIRNASSLEFSKCRAMDIYKTDNVSGKQVLVSYKYCDWTRRVSEACGPAGKLFEPKPRPWYAFWRAA